jgi:hypothetical protein
MTDIFSNAVEVICWPSHSAKKMRFIDRAFSTWHNNPNAHGIALRSGTIILKPREIGKSEKALASAKMLVTELDITRAAAGTYCVQRVKDFRLGRA